MSKANSERAFKGRPGKATKYAARQGSSFLYFKFVKESNNTGTLYAYCTNFSVLTINVTRDDLSAFLAQPIAMRGSAFQTLSKRWKANFAAHDLSSYHTAQQILHKHGKAFVLTAPKGSNVMYYSVAPAGSSITAVTIAGSHTVIAPPVSLVIDLAKASVSNRAAIFSQIVKQAVG
jgi:hypothetical protein